MTKALNVYNECIASMHLTCQIINEYDVRLWHIVEEYVPPSKVDLDSRDYAFEIDSTSQNIPFECDVSIRSDSIIHKIDDKVYAIQVQSTFRFLKEVHDYFTINSSSDIFESQLQEICASYTAPAIVLGAVDNALKLSHKAHLKDFKLAGYHESFVRQIAQDRSAELKALLPWLNHFSNKLNNVGQRTQFIHLVSQLQIILPQINCIHQYNFDDYKLLLTMAGDFSPLLNHLQKRTQTVFAN